MEAKRKSSESRRRTTFKTEIRTFKTEMNEEDDSFVVATDRSTLLGEYNSQMLKCESWIYTIIQSFKRPYKLL